MYSFEVLAYKIIIGRGTEVINHAENLLLFAIHRHLTGHIRSPPSVGLSVNLPASETFDLVLSQDDSPSINTPSSMALSDNVLTCLAKGLDDWCKSTRPLVFFASFGTFAGQRQPSRRTSRLYLQV